MNNENKKMSRRQAIKGIGAVALGTTALAASSTAKANEKKTKKELDGKTALITGGARGIPHVERLTFGQQEHRPKQPLHAGQPLTQQAQGAEWSSPP